MGKNMQFDAHGHMVNISTTTAAATTPRNFIFDAHGHLVGIEAVDTETASGYDLQFDAHGHLVFVEESAPTNPCDPDPEVLVIVTGASGTINWCGETWNLPADSGVEKSVCPTTYLKTKYYTTSGPTAIDGVWRGEHLWYHNAATGIDLLLERRYQCFRMTYGSPTYYKRSYGPERIKLGALGSDYLSHYFYPPAPGPRPIAANGVYVFSSVLGVLTSGVAEPTYSGYDLLDEFFGSYETGGITYSWARGGGW